MAGAYCQYCNQRCFVYREVRVDGGAVAWAGHMATCPAGMAHDRAALGGQDADTAHNPYAQAVTR